MPRTKRIAVGALFGVVIFVSKMGLPTPIDKMFIFVEALLLALGSFVLGGVGATYVASIAGLLTTLWRPSFAPFSLIFAILYGMLVDVLFYLVKVRTSSGNIRTGRLVISLTLSTAAIGLLSTYVMVTIGLMPMMTILYLIILIGGIINGVVAGYIASFIWNRYLKNLK